jgi:beta-1,4-N-acetylglucosaminyltransferase
MVSSSESLQRNCLVTVGATVGFKALTEQVLKPSFWEYLRTKKYTTLHIQCGPDVSWASSVLKERKNEIPSGLEIDVFDVRNNLMKEEMVLCKAVDGLRAGGLVISHAGKHLPKSLYQRGHNIIILGTGTILDAWKLGLSIIVVPNKQLLDDHQTEMAKHLAKEGYATMSNGRHVFQRCLVAFITNPSTASLIFKKLLIRRSF